MPLQERGTDRATGVAGRGLHPEVLERALAHDAAVRHAVEGHATGHHEILGAGEIVRVLHTPQHRGLADDLHRRREVHLPLRDELVVASRRSAEELVELGRGHRVAVAVVEVVEVEPDRAVVVDLHQLLEDQVDVLGIAVRRETHELVFAGVHLEARVVGEGGIQHADGVRVAKLSRQLDPVPPADPDGAGRPFPDAVECEDGRLVERRREERARRVRLVMIGEREAAGELRAEQPDESRPRCRGGVPTIGSPRRRTNGSPWVRRSRSSRAAARTSPSASRRTRRGRRRRW